MRSRPAAPVLWFFLYSFSLAAVTHPVAEEKKHLADIVRYFEEKNYDEAWKLYREVAARYPASSLFDYYGGLILLHLDHRSVAIRDGEYKKAIALLQKAADVFSRNAKAFPVVRRKYIDCIFHQALAHYTIGNRKLAINLFHQVVTLDDRHQEAWYNLGTAYERMDDVVEANRAWARYLYLKNAAEEEF